MTTTRKKSIHKKEIDRERTRFNIAEAQHFFQYSYLVIITD